MSHSGKRYLVTGAASGIGLGIARRLLSDAATVVMSDRTIDAVEAARKSLASDPERTAVVAGDLLDAAAIKWIADA